MRTEIQIARKNVKEYKNPFPGGIEGNLWTHKIREGIYKELKITINQHTQDCERFLHWLIKHRESDNACMNLKNLRPKSKKLEEGYKAALECQIGIYDEKITDLKSTIKLYDKLKIA